MKSLRCRLERQSNSSRITGKFSEPLTPFVPSASLMFASANPQRLSLVERHSGSNSQVASELRRPPTKHTVYILDEPTTGLSFSDVQLLIEVLLELRTKGHTVIVIEHHLDVVKSSDWVIDLGPEGGERGGNILVEGTPEDIAACEASFTGQFLAEMLS